MFLSEHWDVIQDEAAAKNQRVDSLCLVVNSPREEGRGAGAQ